MRESRVPSSQLGRLWEFGGLAASMAFGAAGERFNRPSSNSGEQSSFILSAGNMDRLVAKLSKMRGAALKLGQMMSFQGELPHSDFDCPMLIVLQTPKCFQSPSRKCCSECKTVQIICQRPRETQCWQPILATTGEAFSNHSMRNPWQLHRLARCMAPC